jgi:hypothetical protein
MNSDSEGLVKDALNDPGFHLKRRVIKKQFIRNNTILKKNIDVPIIRSHFD